MSTSINFVTNGAGILGDTTTYSVLNDDNYFYMPFVDKVIDSGPLKTLGNISGPEVAVVCGDLSIFNGTTPAIYETTVFNGTEFVTQLNPVVTITPEYVECLNLKKLQRGNNGHLTVDELSLLCKYTQDCTGFSTGSHLKRSRLTRENLNKYTDDPNKGLYIQRSFWTGGSNPSKIALDINELTIIGKTKLIPGVALRTNV